MRKTSRFNTFIQQAESVVVYNSLWNTFIVTNCYYANLLKNKKCNVDDYKNEMLFNTLENKRMILDNSIDELKIVEQTLENTNNPPSFFELIINPTLACNFRCWYCYESHQDTSTIDDNEIQGIIALTRNILINKGVKKFVLKFFGGEPLLCYEKLIRPVLDELYAMMIEYDVEFSAGITTNGYLLSKERLEFLKRKSVRSLQITLDGNKKRHNSVRFTKKGTDSYSRIIKNIRDALSYGIMVSVRLNISSKTNLDTAELLEDFNTLRKEEKNLLVFNVYKVWQEDHAVYEIIDQIVSQIRASGYRCVSYFSSPSSIWNTCYADKPNHLTINPKGKIYKCTACNFSDEHVEGLLDSTGEIKWNSLHEKRLKATPLKFSACRECSILPICVGNCSQRLLESNNYLGCPIGMNSIQKQQYAYRVLSEKLERQ